MTVLAGMSAAILVLVPIINPVNGPVTFAGFTAGNAPTTVCPRAWKTGIYMFAILTVLAVSGSFVVRFFDFDLPSPQIAGGLVVARSGFSMLENRRRAIHEEAQHTTFKPDVSFSPMAPPLVVGPGSIGVVIVLAACSTTIGFYADIILGTTVTTAVIALLLRYGTPWVGKLGATGVGAIVRIMGSLTLVIDIELIVHRVRAPQLF